MLGPQSGSIDFSKSNPQNPKMPTSLFVATSHQKDAQNIQIFPLSSRLSQFGCPLSLLCASHSLCFSIFSRVSDRQRARQSFPVRSQLSPRASRLECRLSLFWGWHALCSPIFFRVSDCTACSVRPAGGSILQPAQLTNRPIWAPRSDRPDRRVNDY